MSTPRQILAAIFDMDGLLIDSEPLWDQAELEVMASLGVDITRRHELPDTLGLRIDMVVDLWYAQQPWNGPDRQAVTDRIITRAISLVEETRPLLPGVREAVALCKSQGLMATARIIRQTGKARIRSMKIAFGVLSWLSLRNDPTAAASFSWYALSHFSRQRITPAISSKGSPARNAMNTAGQAFSQFTVIFIDLN